MNKISIIIPIYNEKKYITQCLNSIVHSDYSKEAMEVLLIDGGSKDGTIEIIQKYQEHYLFFKLLHNPKKVAPVAMNIGIKASTGEYIFIISAHAQYPRNYFKKLVEFCKRLDADCVGPILKTDTKAKTKTANAIKNVLSDRLGVGSAFRSGVKQIQEVDTVAFGCYRKDVFEKIGLYDERLVRNQDIELNKRLKSAGGKIYIIPEIEATYFAREHYLDLAKNSFANGKWNILTAYYTKRLSSLSLRHFIPMLFVLALFLLLLLGLWRVEFIYLFLALFFGYFTIIFFRSLQIKKDTSLLHQIVSFLVLHFSYGIGGIVGIMQVIKKKVKNGKKV